MFKDADHTAFRTSAALFLLDDDLDSVSVHGSPCPVSRDKDITVPSLYRHEAEPFRMPAERSRDGKCLRLAKLSLGRKAQFAFL